MALTKALNSKANIKQYSNTDLPLDPRVPVINKYGPVDSTTNQTVINLTFSVDQNNKDQFQLYVDGKLLSEGASNDFTFTSIGLDNTSSQVTLNYSIAAGLNIQAYKLGLKKESELVMDSRFMQLYSATDAGFQAFVDENSNRLLPTTATGTPPTGYFYSSITNRASITDLTKDLKPRMGIERVMTQRITQLQNEFGPNGEPVWSAVNDDRGLIRFVGGSWVSQIGNAGVAPVFGNVLNDYVEITFYGTGLNLLTRFYSINWTSTSLSYSVNGVGSTNLSTTNTYSSALNGRNYSANQVLPVVSNQSLGLYTIKISVSNLVANGIFVYGFEVLNESSSVLIPPGTAYNKNQQYNLASLQSHSYSSVVTGTKGGRVVEYLTSSGTVGQAWQAVDASAGYLGTTSHSNEEIIRTYSTTEFGAGRTDDFSLDFNSANRAFTLDDGTTTLIGTSINSASGTTAGVVVIGNTLNAFVTLTFVGTGLDITRFDQGTTIDSHTVTVDGTLQGSLTAVGTANLSRVTKVCSGLPYGTHTVKFTRTATGGNAVAFQQFTIYGPKKPSIPSGAIELADYNVMADFVANSTASVDTISTGVLRKQNIRELVYVDGTGGTQDWAIQGVVDPTFRVGGWEATTDRAGGTNGYIEYTFFGTGFDMRYLSSSNRTSDARVTVNGLSLITSNFSGLVTTTYGTGTAYDATTNGSLDQRDAASSYGSGFTVKNLPLGKHTVRIRNNVAGEFLSICTIDIITPIHSPKSNLYADLQNTLPVGSCGISDNRKVTPVKEALPAQKAWAQAVGITTPVTVSSTSAYVPCPDLSLTIKTGTSALRLFAHTEFFHPTTANQQLQMLIYVDGSPVGVRGNGAAPTISSNGNNSFTSCIVPVSAGVHKVDVYIQSTSSTLQLVGTNRILTAEEL